MFKKSTLILSSAAACAVMSFSVNAAIVTGVTTDNGGLDGDLTSVSTATDTYSDLKFSTASNIAGGTIIYLDGSALPIPASSTAALSDQSAATGTLGAGAGATFSFGAGNVNASDVLFIIFNAGTTSFYQGPGLITAIDAGGASLGTFDASGATVFGDQFDTYNAARVGNTTLTNRPIGGVTVDVASFGVADASLIAGFIVPGEDLGSDGNSTSFDPNIVGLAVVPEPASLALIGIGGLVMLRRRK